MDFVGHDSLPDDLIETAISEYKYSERATIEEKLAINQYRYSNEHGPFRIERERDFDTLTCTLHVDGDAYTSHIPLRPDPVAVDVYPFGDIQFENIQLISVCLRHEFSWAHEAFVAAYWAEPAGDDVDEFVADKTRILMRYYLPRGLTEDESPLPEVAEYGEPPYFAPRDIRNFTHAATPNPWAQYSTMVVYEDEALAERVLTHDDVHMPADRYHRTPPEDLHG